MQHGMRPLVLRSLQSVTGISLVFLAIAYGLGGQPPLWLFMAYLLIVFFAGTEWFLRRKDNLV